MKATRTCITCGAAIPRQTKWSKDYYQRRLYCNPTCQRAAQPDIAYDYSVTPSGCWEWKGHVDRNGYGKGYDPTRAAGSRYDWAHRISYRLHIGPIPAHHELDHTCQNPPCINPKHLEAVTRVEHVRRTYMRLGKTSRHTGAA